MHNLYPKSLKSNSTIGLLCPAGGFNDYKTIHLIKKYLNLLNYKVRLGKSLISSDKYFSYLSGTDKQRSADFMSFWLDASIDAIFCLRGGYGCLRLVNNIDFKKLKSNKKIFLGFSDITILLLAIYKKCNLITFHGPLLGFNFIKSDLKPYDKQTENNLWSLLKSPNFSFKYTFTNSHILKGGISSGKLIGGNLSDIVSLIGSGFLPDFSGSILFLEDCFEEPYKIDRMITQLINASLLKGINGLICSSFYKCNFKSSNHVLKLLKDKLQSFGVPLVYGFPTGHSYRNFVLPIGKKVILDTQKRVLYSVT